MKSKRWMKRRADEANKSRRWMRGHESRRSSLIGRHWPMWTNPRTASRRRLIQGLSQAKDEPAQARGLIGPGALIRRRGGAGCDRD